jgi:tetratricopeptide (TPR) repeat protein
MWNNLGMAYEHLDRLDEARDAYKQALELKGERAHENLARLAGVKSIKTAKIDSVRSDVTPTDDVPHDEVVIDGGVK